MNCTWKGCAEAATHDETSKDGAVWARLCDVHHAEVDGAHLKGPKATLRTWVLAQGGADAAAKRMAASIETGDKLFRMLAPSSTVPLPSAVLRGMLARFEVLP